MHTVFVADERVDFAVVSYAAEWLGKPPVRKCIRAVPLMNRRQRAFHRLIGKVGIIREQLPGHKHSLVADCPAAHRTDIKIVRSAAESFQRQFFSALACEEKFSFKFVRLCSATVDKELANVRLGFKSYFAETIRFDRHVANADNF